MTSPTPNVTANDDAARAAGGAAAGTGDWHERPDAEFGAHRIPPGGADAAAPTESSGVGSEPVPGLGHAVDPDHRAPRAAAQAAGRRRRSGRAAGAAAARCRAGRGLTAHRRPACRAGRRGAAAAGAAPAVGRRGPRARSGRRKSRGPRRARLQLRHIDTWSALKISLVLSIALFFIWMVAVGVLYGVLERARRLRHPQRPVRSAEQRPRVERRSATSSRRASSSAAPPSSARSTSC